jgi:hypothetical protein
MGGLGVSTHDTLRTYSTTTDPRMNYTRPNHKIKQWLPWPEAPYAGQSIVAGDRRAGFRSNCETERKVVLVDGAHLAIGPIPRSDPGLSFWPRCARNKAPSSQMVKVGLSFKQPRVGKHAVELNSNSTPSCPVQALY